MNGGVLRDAFALTVLLTALLAAGCERGPEPLITTAMTEGDALPAPFTALPGRPAEGEAIFVERARGHCVICHQLTSVDAPFQGNVGPDLSGIGERLTPGQLRLRVAHPAAIWPDTLMPSYYRVTGLTQVAPEFAGRSILTAQEIEDVVAFLSAQRARPDAPAL